MTKKGKVISGLVTVAVAGVVLALSFLPADIEGHKHVDYTTNAGELTDGVLVGQTFVSQRDDLSGVSVMFATYSNRNNSGKVELHLRESYTAREDLRVAYVDAGELSDNKHHTFEFEPVKDSKGKTYFFFVVAPGGRKGSSVTVDLDTRDPYHLGTAFIARYAGASIPSGEVLSASGKPTVDVPFGTYYEVSARDAMFYAARSAWTGFRSSWQNEKDNYALWAIMLLLAATFAAAVAVLALPVLDGYKWKKWQIACVLAGLLAAAIGIRLWYADAMPVTNDEGNYLYDAWMLREGKLAGGDGYVKAPLVVAWVALWQMLLGQTVMAGRFASILAGALTLVPIYFIGKRLGNERSGMLAAAAWALFGAPAVFNVYVHTQAVADLLGVSGAAAVLSGVKSGGSAWRLVLAGILLGLGVASRKSVLALGLIPLLVIIIESNPWKERLRQLVSVGFGFIIVSAIVMGGAFYVYGQEGFWEATGFNSAEDGITAVDPEEADQVREYSLRGMTPFFRESLPFILLGLIGWGILLEKAMIPVTVRYFRGQSTYLKKAVAALGWVLPIMAGWWAWRFFFEYDGEPYVSIWGMGWLWACGAVLIAIVALLFDEEEDRAPERAAVLPQSTQPVQTAAPAMTAPNVVSGYAQQAVKKTPARSASASASGWREKLIRAGLPLVWMAGLVIFYMSWFKFHANYIVEFLPPLAITVGAGAFYGWRRIMMPQPSKRSLRGLKYAAAVFAAFVIIWAIFVSNVITYQVPHTGTFEKGSIKEAAEWAQKYIPENEPIFTGAAVVPYLSGRRAALDIAHPRWYAYEFTRKDTERLNTFLPPAEEMLEAYRNANWFMLEKQTGFSFLMEYSEIEAGLERDWQLVHEVENGSNTIQFYRRMRQGSGV